MSARYRDHQPKKIEKEVVKKSKPVNRRSRIFDTGTKRQARGDRSILRTQIIVGVVLAIVIALVITGIYYGTRISSMQIEQVTVVGGFTISHTEVEQDVQVLLEGSYIRLIPRRFAWFYPKQAILQKLHTIPRMKQVAVELDGHKTLAVAFDEYQPFALWCASATSTACYFLDKEGYAFAAAPSLTGAAFVRYTEPGATTSPQTQAIPVDVMRGTTDLIQRLQDTFNLYVTNVTIAGDNDIDYTLAGGGTLKTSTQLPIDRTFDNLKTILNSTAYATLKNGTFGYIDLRFGDKVYVSEHVATSTSPVTASSTGL